MSESKAGARPSQVTMAGWMAVVGSGLLVVSLFDVMSNVRSIEIREGIEEFLATPIGAGTGLDVEGTTELLRGLTLFTGGAAAAAVVLSIFVLQRNNSARLGFTIAAVPIALTAPLSGGFLAVMVAFAATMLWTRPARDWFSGTIGDPVRQDLAQSDLVHQDPVHQDPIHQDPVMSPENNPPEGSPPSAPDVGGQEWPRMPAASSDRPVPPPTHGFGSPTPPSYPQQPEPQGYPQGYPQGGPPGAPPGGPPPQQGPSWPPPTYGQPQQYAYSGFGQEPDKRPTTVTVAAWLTWISAGLTLATFGLVVLVMLVAKEPLLDALEREPEFQQTGISTDELIAALWVVSAVVMFWCLCAIVLAVFAYRRANWARITLVVSAATAALLSLASFPFGLLNTMAAGATVVLLFVGGANEWYSRKGSGYPPSPFGPQAYGRQQGGQPSQHGQPGQPPYAGQPPGGQGPYTGQPGEPPQQGDQPDPPKNVW